MKFALRYSADALKDLDSIWTDVFQASDSFDIADNYIDGLLAEVSRIQNHPKTGSQLFFDDVFTGIRYIRYKAYLVFYRIGKQHVEVSRILLAKSDYLKTLFPGEG